MERKWGVHTWKESIEVCVVVFLIFQSCYSIPLYLNKYINYVVICSSVGFSELESIY